MCNTFCKDFHKEVCPKSERPPYVCNGCGAQNGFYRKLYESQFDAVS